MCVTSSGPPGKRGRRGDPGESYFSISALFMFIIFDRLLSHRTCLSNVDSELDHNSPSYVKMLICEQCGGEKVTNRRITGERSRC